MENTEFLLNCILAITIVFLVLSVLSLSIRILITIFPEKSSDDSAAFFSAVTTHLSRIYPQSHITKLEEQK